MYLSMLTDKLFHFILVLCWGHWERATEEITSLHTSKWFFLSALTFAMTKYLITSIIAAIPFILCSISMLSPNYCFGKQAQKMLQCEHITLSKKHAHSKLHTTRALLLEVLALLLWDALTSEELLRMKL